MPFSAGRWVQLLACVIAFGLGCPLLGMRALWGDETYSVWAARQPLAALVAGLDTLPPLYYLVLKAWLPFAGASEFSARFPSLFFGVLVGPLTAGAGAMLFGRAVRPRVAVLAALSAPLVYMLQEARIYTLALALCAALFVLAFNRHKRPLAAGLLAIAALFTHLYALPIVVMCALYGVLTARLRRMGALWAACMFGAIALFGVWFWWAQQTKVVEGRSFADFAGTVPGMDQLMRYALDGTAGLLAGYRAPAWSMWPAAGLALALPVVALMLRRNVRVLFCAATATACVAVPLVSSGWVPAFHPRYFVFACLPIIMLTGLLMDRRWLRLALATAMAAISLIALPPLYDSSWAKTGYDALMRALRTGARPGDVAILLNSDQVWPLEYYGPTTLPEWLVPNGLNAETGRSEVELRTRDARRVWLVSYGASALSEQSHFVMQNLSSRGERVMRREFGDAVLSLFQLGEREALPLKPFDIPLDAQIQLAGAALENARYSPGDSIRVDLAWRALAPIARDYTVFLHLRRADDDLQIAAFDGAPANGSRPTSGWRSGEVIVDRRGITVPDDAPPGRYRLVTGLYSFPSFDRLTRDDGQGSEIVIGEIEVVR